MNRSPMRRTPFARSSFTMKRVSLRPMSKKRRSYLRSSGYSARSAAARLLPCAVQSPVCWGRADGLHHVLARSAAGGLEAAERDGITMPACNLCNEWIATHALWARANGFMVRLADLREAA